MRKILKAVVHSTLILTMGVYLSGCYASQHVVGTGGTYAGNEIEKYDVKKKHWYLFWGAMPLDDVSAHMLAGDAQNYTSRETSSFGDMCLSALTWGIAAPRTIRISKSAAEK